MRVFVIHANLMWAYRPIYEYVQCTLYIYVQIKII